MNQQYYQELKKHKPLTDTSINELALKIKTGDSKALDELVKSNLRLVVLIAKSYYITIQNENIFELEDLISEGNLGLIKACQRYNPELGVKFTYYASLWIKNAIQSSIDTHEKHIKIPANIIASSRKINEIVKELFIKNECEVTPEEIKELGLFSQNEIDQYFIKRNFTSIDEHFNLIDESADFNIDESVDYKSTIQCALSKLKPKERLIIENYFGIDKDKITLIDMSKDFNFTRQRASQIKNKALAKLKEILKGIDFEL